MEVSMTELPDDVRRVLVSCGWKPGGMMQVAEVRDLLAELGLCWNDCSLQFLSSFGNLVINKRIGGLWRRLCETRRLVRTDLGDIVNKEIGREFCDSEISGFIDELRGRFGLDLAFVGVVTGPEGWDLTEELYVTRNGHLISRDDYELVIWGDALGEGIARMIRDRPGRPGHRLRISDLSIELASRI